MESGLIPALTRNSARTLLSLVCPDLRSSPPMNDLRFSASSMTPGTNVFWGAPLMKGTPSRMEATAKMALGATSSCECSIDARMASAVSLTPGIISLNRSVFAVQNTMTWSRSLTVLNSRISLRICSRCARLLVPGMTLSARSSWLAAI